MSIEIRPVTTDAEAAQHGFISAYAFDGERGEEAMLRRSIYYDRGWLLAAFDQGEMVAGLTIIPFEQYFEGAAIPLGGVASVSCLPEHRRSGHVGALLRRALETMREAGQPLSALWTPHPSLYRKYGWENASRLFAYTFPPKHVRPRLAEAAGSWRRVGAESWPELNAIYDEHYRARNGALRRDERRWRNHIFSDYGKGAHDAAVWSDGDGRAHGYVVYRTRRTPVASSHWPETTLRVVDWCAVRAGAYAAVIRYVTSHDLADNIVMLAGADEPLILAVEEPNFLKQPAGAWPGIMLRLVDVPAAIAARPASPLANGCEAVVDLTDETAPWNAGRWRIGAHHGRLECERSGRPAAASMDTGTLATLYNGCTRPAEAQRIGILQAKGPADVETLTRLFATACAPYCPDDF